MIDGYSLAMWFGRTILIYIVVAFLCAFLFGLGAGLLVEVGIL